MKRFLSCLAVLLAAVQIIAAPVDLSAAQARALQFVQQHAADGVLRSPAVGTPKLIHAEMNSALLDRAVFYIFDTGGGYVIVSGDDRAEEILGYGDGHLDVNAMPCNMRAWLETYKVQLEYLQAHEGLQVEPMPRPSSPMLRIASVAPLLPALWDQEAPYWNECRFGNYQCFTGCPATSAAMVMHYWKYPTAATPAVPGYRSTISYSSHGSVSYTHASLPSVTFDWDNMLDSYSNGYNSAQAKAVARLMHYVGQAERMEYGTAAAGGSGLKSDSVQNIVDALILFGYDRETVRLVKKTSSYAGGTTLYTDAEWAALIQEELIEGRPVVFCAIAGGVNGGGHAFNVDGYDATTNKFHVNWGWSGTSNNYYALNAFNGGGALYNQYQQMVIGIQPPLLTPQLRATESELSMSCFKNRTATASFTVKGRNIEGVVNLTLDDANGVFSIDKATLAPNADGKVEEQVVVTYSPTAEGEYTATLRISAPDADDVVITLHGSSDYELYRPVMQELDESTVTSTSFRADWSDNTPAENVTGYTLEVMMKPEVSLLTEADWSNVPEEDINHAADAANYLPEGWSFTGDHFYLDGGFVSASRQCVISAHCDMMGYHKVSVLVTAMAYKKGISSTLTIATDQGEQTLTMGKILNTYLVVLEVGPHSSVRFTTGYYPEIQSIKIYGGEITDPAPYTLRATNETGDADYRLIEGITPDKFYTVTGLRPATDYLYRVKACYVNGTESMWSNAREVITAPAGDFLPGDVNGDQAVNMGDVTTLIEALLVEDLSQINFAAADVSGDGNVNILDVTVLLTMLLTNK